MAMATKKTVAVIGGGVVGLAVSQALARAHGRLVDVLLLESETQIGLGTSSRNSGVLHAGIYYPYDSWKRKLCVDGHRQILDFCQQYHVPHQLCGKLIVDDRNSDEGMDTLNHLYESGTRNGARLEMITDAAQLQEMEPHLHEGIQRAIFSPMTGIIDVNAYMLALLGVAEENGVQVCYNVALQGSSQSDDGKHSLLTSQGPLDEIDCVINAAGLHACEVARMVEPEQAGAGLFPQPEFAKGTYWREAAREGVPRATFSRLIYPLPEPGGLGTHLTKDLDGSIRFGPNVEWLGEAGACLQAGGRNLAGLCAPSPPDPAVYDSIARYYPGVGQLEPDYAGIRPKLKLRGAGAASASDPDFQFAELPRSLHLFGVESPGLTSSLAIAGEAVRRVGWRLSAPAGGAGAAEWRVLPT